MADVVVDDNGDLPHKIEEVLHENHWKIWAPDGQEQMEPYENQRRGKCLTCGGHLEENTQMLVGHEGILGLWCSGECLADIVSLGFLREMEELVVERVEGRRDAD